MDKIQKQSGLQVAINRYQLRGWQGISMGKICSLPVGITSKS